MMHNIQAIPAFNDNYIWCIFKDQQQAVVVDPGDAEPVKQFLQQRDLQLLAILITHHHYDHVGGIDELVADYHCKVYGPDNQALNNISYSVTDHDAIELLNLKFDVMTVPGHTLDHLAYITTINDTPQLFCGDTLFAGGCGRIFEGTPEMMYDSLQRINQLPAETLVYCAHEYTVANLHFAEKVDTGNKVLHRRLEIEQSKRDNNVPTVPSTLAIERATNPFLRSDTNALMNSASRFKNQPVAAGSATFAAIRELKDNS